MLVSLCSPLLPHLGEALPPVGRLQDGRRLVQRLHQDLVQVAVLQRRLPQRKLQQRDAQRPDVRAAVVPAKSSHNPLHFELGMLPGVSALQSYLPEDTTEASVCFEPEMVP